MNACPPGGCGSSTPPPWPDAPPGPGRPLPPAQGPGRAGGSPPAAFRRRHEDPREQRDPLVLELLQEVWEQPRRLQLSTRTPVLIGAGLEVEEEDVLERDHVALHPHDLGDVGDPAAPVLQSGLVDDYIYGRGDLFTHR